jgi:hypothetical protein
LSSAAKIIDISLTSHYFLGYSWVSINRRRLNLRRCRCRLSCFITDLLCYNRIHAGLLTLNRSVLGETFLFTFRIVLTHPFRPFRLCRSLYRCRFTLAIIPLIRGFIPFFVYRQV